MATTNPDGTITVASGDTLSGIYGSNWQAASGYTGDPTKLAVGTVLPSPTTTASTTKPSLPTTVGSPQLGAGASGTPTIPTGTPKATGGAPANAADAALKSLPTPTTPVAPTQTLTADEQAAKDSASKLSAGIVTSEGQLANKSADTTKALSDAGVATLKATLNTLNNTITQKTADLATYDANQQKTQDAIEQQPVALSVITGQQAEQARQSAITRASMVAEIGMYNAQVQATQGNITLATQTATDAINAKYQPILDQIQIQKDQLAAIQPFLTSGEAKEAANQSLKITQYQNAVNQEAQNKKDVSAVVMSAAANGAPSSVLATIGKATDQISAATAAKGYLSNSLDNQLKQAQLTKLNLENTASKAAASGTGASVTLQNPTTGQAVIVSADMAPYVNFSNNGVSYLDASKLEGTAASKAALVTKAQLAGIKPIFNANTANDLSNIKDANNKLDSISTIMAGLAQPSALKRNTIGILEAHGATFLETDPQKSAAGALSSVGLDMLKALSGVQGFRGNTAVVQQINDHMPTIFDTVDTANQKIAYIRGLISDREDGLVGAPPASTGPQMYAGVTLPSNTTTTGSSYAGVTLPH